MAADPASLGQLAVASSGSATVVALCNHLFAWRKTRAEADKLAAEAENIRTDFQNLASDECKAPPGDWNKQHSLICPSVSFHAPASQNSRRHSHVLSPARGK